MKTMKFALRISAGVAVAILLVGTGYVLAETRHPDAAGQLKTIHGVMKAYSEKNSGQLPALQSGGSPLMFPIKGMYPDYVTDPRLLVNPANEKAAERVEHLSVNPKNLPLFWNNGSYWYLGYAMTNEKEGLAFVNAYKALLEKREAPWGDLKVAKGDGDGGSSTIHRLSEDVTRYFIRDINNPAATAVSTSQIPVMIAKPVDGGGNVLYLDGHVEFLRYPGKFPMTPAFIKGIESLDALGKSRAQVASAK